MSDLPILMGRDMVLATLDGRKTQTRRPVFTPQASRIDRAARDCWDASGFDVVTPQGRLVRHAWTPTLIRAMLRCPYGRPGGRLWVKETLRSTVLNGLACYAADNAAVLHDGEWARWRWERPVLPSIHMPRWASRLPLEVLDIRVEHLQGISDEDIIAEGIAPSLKPSEARAAFQALWDGIYAPRGFSWTSNPWVWVITVPKQRRSHDG